ncbi:MAG: hypothetical protein KY463_09190, partial [Actinobacteria bacterium]|nr:hypothetical protein [Actinomycetota bacterium]
MSAPEAYRPQIRELTLPQLLEVAVRICLTHWRTLLKAVLVVIVPVQIISTLLTADYTLSSFDVGSSSEQTTREAIDELNRHIDGLVVSSLLQILALAFATAACLRAIISTYLGERPDWRASLAFALRRAGPLVALTALYLAGVMLGAIALLLPGIWLYIAWAFALPVLLVHALLRWPRTRIPERPDRRILLLGLPAAALALWSGGQRTRPLDRPVAGNPRFTGSVATTS